MGIEAKINELLACFRMPRYDVEQFFLSDAELEDICRPLPHGVQRPPPKREQDQTNWKLIHEEYFSLNCLEWPANIDHLGGKFRHREGELVVAADRSFPCKPEHVGLWMFFDTNHTLERSLNYGSGGNPRNPWQLAIPTATSMSAMVGRLVGQDGSVRFKHVHPVELMQMQGWTLPFYAAPIFDAAYPKMDVDMMGSLVGNGWSLFHLCPLVKASFGAIDWSSMPEGVLDDGMALAHRARNRCESDDESESSGSLPNLSD